jgi:hypothetical protein
MGILLIGAVAIALFGIGAYIGLERLKHVNIWHVMVAIAIVGLLIATAEVPALWVIFAIIAAVVFFARAWVREFSFLMSLRDENFPGRSDKLIWAFVLVALPPVGLLAFRAVRKSHWPEPAEPERDAPKVRARPASDMV